LTIDETNGGKAPCSGQTAFFPTVGVIPTSFVAHIIHCDDGSANVSTAALPTPLYRTKSDRQDGELTCLVIHLPDTP
jgi:hypothetical protein